MKTKISGFLSAMTFIALMFYGCSKSVDLNTDGNLQLPDIMTPAGQHVYGLLPMTPDQYMNVPLYSRELLVSKLGLKAVTLNPTYLDMWTPAIRDQLQIGSCTAFCGAETNEILYHYKPIPTDKVLSPAFIYYCERVLIQKQKITADNGAYMVNIPQALQAYGDCLEGSYPYPTSNKTVAYKTAPSTAAMTEAKTYKIPANAGSSIYWGAIAATNTDAGVIAVKTLLSNNIPVMMGFNVDDNTAYTYFERLSKTNFTYNPLKADFITLATGVKVLGGHAVPIVGYDDAFTYTSAAGVTTTGAFKCQNSWGLAWGNSGFFYIPYSVFKSTKIVALNDVYFAKLI